jgi:PAS domain S-box-containing protein
MLAAKVQSRLCLQGHWHKLFEAYPFPAAVANARHAFIYVNPAFEKFYGKTMAEVVGLTPWILMPRDHDIRAVQELRRQLTQGKDFWQGRFVNVNAAGKAVPIHLIVIALRGRLNAEPIAYMSLAAPQKDESLLLPTLAQQLGNFWLEEAASVKVPPPGKSGRGERQEEILRLTRMGYSTKEVAVFMGIATSTVANVKWKLGRRNRTPKRR